MPFKTGTPQGPMIEIYSKTGSALRLALCCEFKGLWSVLRFKDWFLALAKEYVCKTRTAPFPFLSCCGELIGIYFLCFWRDSLILGILNQSKILWGFVVYGKNLKNNKPNWMNKWFTLFSYASLEYTIFLRI